MHEKALADVLAFLRRVEPSTRARLLADRARAERADPDPEAVREIVATAQVLGYRCR